MNRRLHRGEADALLDGTAADAREPGAAVGDLLSAARGPALPDELAGRVAALDAFLAVRATGAFAPSPPTGVVAATETVPAVGRATPSPQIPAARTGSETGRPAGTFRPSTRRVGRGVGALVLGLVATGAAAVVAVAASQPSGPAEPPTGPPPAVVLSSAPATHSASPAPSPRPGSGSAPQTPTPPSSVSGAGARTTTGTSPPAPSTSTPDAAALTLPAVERATGPPADRGQGRGSNPPSDRARSRAAG